MSVPVSGQESGAPSVVTPHAPKWHQRLAARLVFSMIRGVGATMRYQWNDRSGYFNGPEASEPVIYCTWHNRLALSMIAYDYVKKHKTSPGMVGLVSASKDGGLLAAILDCFKVQPVRGSSSRRGRQALLELTTWAERGYDVAITPDGPRGPCYVVQEGVTSLAQVTGLAIMPISYYLSWKIQLRSWDRFQIPLPFSRCELTYEKPIRVPRDATAEQREAVRLQLEQTLRRISKD